MSNECSGDANPMVQERSVEPLLLDIAAEVNGVQQIENVWIPTRDGTRLAARIWLPRGADEAPVGAVLEALPYSKRLGSRARDDAWAASFCPHGFAYVRLDLRGTGESEGFLDGEYLPQEQRDLVDVIECLAAQPWCNGAIGMRGYSWGGFNCLQVAALQPPALKAVVTACSTDDRYRLDAHRVGGVVGFSGITWGTVFRTVLAQAPDPAIVGSGWRDTWIARLQNVSAQTAEWLRHDAADSFWTQGSVSADYRAVRCGVYAVGGQIDAYAPAVLRLLAHLDVPRKGLIGSWGHSFPDAADPGPGLDWVAEEVRWWRHWLYGMDTGMMQEPMLHAYVQEQTAGEVWPADTPGRWVAEPSWPSPNVQSLLRYLVPGGLMPDPAPEVPLTLEPHQSLGIAKREWLPFDMSVDLPKDQSRDDALSLSFDGEPLEAGLDVLGTGEVRLRLAADQPIAKVVVRINEVLADGRSWSVSYGVLNLCHREGHDAPRALVPGRFYDVSVPLSYCAHRFRRGSRIRVAISESLWPMLCPSPVPVRLTVMAGSSQLILPCRCGAEELTLGTLPAILRDTHVAVASPSTGVNDDAQPIKTTGMSGDGFIEITRSGPGWSLPLPEIDTVTSGNMTSRLTVADDDPASCQWSVTVETGVERADWRIKTVAVTELHMTPDAFVLRESLQAFDQEDLVFQSDLQNRIVRNCC